MTRKNVLFLLIFILSLSLVLELKCTNIWNNAIEKINEINIENDNNRVIKIQDETTIPDIDTYISKYNNNDIKGVLYIPDTKILEPIVQTSNNDYYLNRDLYKKKDTRGSVFLDYRVSINLGRKNLIYSHNSNIHDVPFKELEKYYEKDYYSKHKYIYLKDEKSTIKYLIFSIYVETSDWTYTKIKFNTDEEWLEHIEELKKKSWYDTDVILDKKDQVLILQTCSHHKKYKNYKDKYLLVIAKRVG